MNRSLFSSLLLAAFVAVVGCSDGAPKPAPKAGVAGTVKLDGQPMADGSVRFYMGTEPSVILPVSGGSFSGEVYVGTSRVEVIREKDGPPHPMDPSIKLKVNTISEQFWGPKSTLKAEVPAGGKQDLLFEVKSGR